MTSLSEVSVLFASRAGDIQRAREVFVEDARSFVEWVMKRAEKHKVEAAAESKVRLDVEGEIVTEPKSSYSVFTHRFEGLITIRYQKNKKFVEVAVIEFGIGADDKEETFVWYVMIDRVRSTRLDDGLWKAWAQEKPDALPPGARHVASENQVVLVERPLAELKEETARKDVEDAMAFVLKSEAIVVDAMAGT